MKQIRKPFNIVMALILLIVVTIATIAFSSWLITDEITAIILLKLTALLIIITLLNFFLLTCYYYLYKTKTASFSLAKRRRCFQLIITVVIKLQVSATGCHTVFFKRVRP